MRSTLCVFYIRPFALQVQELLAAPATSASSTFDDHGLANASLDLRKFSRRALNDWSLEPEARTDQPPDRDNQQHSQHYYRCVVKGSKGADTSSKRCRIDGRQHKQHRDEDNPDHSD